eukprot:g6108.t1
MSFASFSAVSLCLLLFLQTALAYDFSSWLVPVTKKEQLWRYLVGSDNTDSNGITPGDDYICLIDWKGKLVRSTGSIMINDRKDCHTDGRFEVKFFSGNRVALKQASSNKYVSCRKPKLAIASSVGETEKLILYINKDEDKLFLYCPKYNTVAGAYYDNHQLSCSSCCPYGSETFYGWKKGSKEAWKPTDKWQIIGTFDNRESSSTGTFTYSKTVGVEKTKTTSMGASVSITTSVSAGFGDFFSADVSTTIGMEWSQESSKTWQESTTITASIQVLPGYRTSLYQAVGQYGIFTVHANYFRAVDFAAVTEYPHQVRTIVY